MTTAISYLFSSYKLSHEAKWLRRLLYCFLLYKCIYWCIDFNLFFGEGSIVTKNNVGLGFFRSFAFLLFYSIDTWACVALCLCFILGLNGIFLNFLPRLNAVVIWFLVCNINNAVYPSLTGGDFLFQQLLFFNIFLSSPHPLPLSKGEGSASRVFSDLDKALHNFGVIAIIIQICLVYFISGMTKLLSSDWTSGLAVAQTFSIEDFSLPFLYDEGMCRQGVSKFMNYFVMAYQLLFPMIIWFKKTKKWFLLLGVIQHLYIAFVMGLPSFGLIMIIAYSIFYFPSKKISK